MWQPESLPALPWTAIQHEACSLGVLAPKLMTPGWPGLGRGPQKEDHPSFLFLLGLHDVQALQKAGDALLQAVDGVVLRIMATEAVAQAAEGVPNQLQVAGLQAKMRWDCWHVPCY